MLSSDKKMNRFENKTVVITGGGSGIGATASLRLASEGARVLVLDLDIDAAQSVVEKIRETGGQAHAYSCNVASTEEVNQLIAQILVDHKVDVLINNAGIAHVGTIERTSEEDLDRLYQVNVKGVYNLTHALIGSMKTQQKGVILNLASIASCVGISDRFAYSMTKGAVLSMTYSIAKDYVNYGIRCNCIAPGRVHTPFVDNFIAKNYPDNQAEMFEQLSKTQPIGRMGKTEEIAALIAFLCSDEAAFITGTNVPVDGGFITLNS